MGTLVGIILVENANFKVGPYDCRVTIRSNLKMISNIKERISSSKKRLDLLKKIVFGKWLDLDDTNYDNHLLNYVLHHQRPDLSKSIDSDILFDIAGRTLLLGRAEFCLVTGFACGKVVFPKYLDDGIPPFVRRIVTIGHLGELVSDKATKGKAAQPSDKGDKVSVMIRDLGIVFSGSRGKKVVPTFMLRLVNDLAAWDDFPWGEYYWEEFHNKVVNLIDKRKNNHIEFKKENPSKLPTFGYWNRSPTVITGGLENQK
ncbi:phospholipase-like protein [Tanacetum coccineum]